MADDFADRDAIYENSRTTHPGVTFAQFFAQETLDWLKQPGNTHGTLGGNLASQDGTPKDVTDNGLPTFRRYRKLLPIKPDSRVVDYGCGSLRIGSHFIRYLPAGHYLGLDVISGYYEIGKTLFADLMAEKAPRFAVIDEKSVAEAAAFDPDIVFSSAVAFHAHPEEAAAYYANLARIAHRPDATLVFEAVIAERSMRYTHRSWAWPLTWFEAMLPDFRMVVKHEARREKRGVPVSVSILEWRRA